MTDDLRRGYHTDPREYPDDGSLSAGRRIGRLENVVIGPNGHGDRIDKLESWRDELRGVSLVVRFVLGLNLAGLALQLYVALAHP